MQGSEGWPEGGKGEDVGPDCFNTEAKKFRFDFLFTAEIKPPPYHDSPDHADVRFRRKDLSDI